VYGGAGIMNRWLCEKDEKNMSGKIKILITVGINIVTYSLRWQGRPLA
jgi:hypothetical protein